MPDSRIIEVANRVLATFAGDTRIEDAPGGLRVCWTSGGKHYRRRWMCRNQAFYPVWSRLWPRGGTATVALSQLVRWVGGKPVLPLSSWRHWASEKVSLLPAATTDTLWLAGYPEFAFCVLCRERIVGGLDWWHTAAMSGPCCSFTSGCRQEVRNA